jgi:hypothetical protein
VPEFAKRNFRFQGPENVERARDQRDWPRACESSSILALAACACVASSAMFEALKLRVCLRSSPCMWLRECPPFRATEQRVPMDVKPLDTLSGIRDGDVAAGVIARRRQVLVTDDEGATAEQDATARRGSRQRGGAADAPAAVARGRHRAERAEEPAKGNDEERYTMREVLGHEGLLEEWPEWRVRQVQAEGRAAECVNPREDGGIMLMR